MKAFLILGVLLAATMSMAGILPTSRGGTGSNLSSYLSNGGVVTSTAAGMTVVAVGTINQALLSGGAGVSPAWSSTLVAKTIGTAAGQAGLYITSGASLATPAAGAIMNNGTHLFWVDDAGASHRLDN